MLQRSQRALWPSPLLQSNIPKMQPGLTIRKPGPTMGPPTSLPACCPQDCGRTGRSQLHCYFPHQSLASLKSYRMIFHSRKTHTPGIHGKGGIRKELVRNQGERPFTVPSLPSVLLEILSMVPPGP
jgi:hypothetical protein